MKKITLFIALIGFFLAANAQYIFNPVVGPINVTQATGATINLNDVANSAGVTASSTGTYNSFSVTVDWVEGGGGPWSSEAQLTITTASGSSPILSPTTGGANSGTTTTLTFQGDLPGLFDPAVDGYIDLVLGQSFGGSDADWSNIVVTLFETPTCPEPTGLTVANISATSADISWTLGGAETSWNYVIQPAGTGTPTTGSAQSVTSVSESNLTPSANYEVYVQADCGTDTSLWVGPVNFTTLTQFDYTLDCANDGPLTIDFCYNNGGAATPELFTFTSTDGTPLNLTFNSGNIENGWDELVVFDSDGTPFPGFAAADNNYGNNGDISGLTFQSTGDTISWYVNSDGSVSCQSGSVGQVNGINFTVTCATCTNPEATYTVVDDCANGNQFLIDVDITNLGSATSLVISNNIDANTTPVNATGVYQVGPFPFLVDVVITVTNDQDGNCFINSSPVQEQNCPPPAPVGVTCTTGNASFIFTADFDAVEGWTGDLNGGNGTWEIPDGSGSGGTGADAPFNGGAYMNYEASGGTTALASAITPIIDLTTATDGAELSFYMHAFGADMGTLNVGVSNSPTGPFTNAFSWTGEYQTAGSDPWVPIGINLDTYLGQQIYVEFSYAGTGTGWEGDMSLDYIRVETCGTFCIAPSGITVNNINATSADISWTANSGETSWEYVVQPAGTGIPTTGTTVTVTSVTVNNLNPSTNYEVYVLANCPSGDSVWTGPVNFTTPLQFDYVLDCATDGPVTVDFCYDNGGAATPELFTFTSTDGTPLNLTFNSGIIENGWDELVVFDSDGTPFPGYAAADNNYGNNGDISGLTFQSTGDTISWYVNSDGSVSCQSGSPGEVDGINFTVSCATCINPQATYTVVDDCANGNQFLIDVNIVDLGDATSLTISNNIDANTIPVPATGTYQIGPFPFLVDVIVTVSSDQDTNCVINSNAIQLLACPPTNNTPCDATIAVVNTDILCETRTSGTILAATPSGVPNPSCGGDADDDVWFQFVAQSEFQLIALANVTGSSVTDMNHSLYQGTCDNLVEISCVNGFDELSSVSPQLVIGDTYYVRIYSGDSDAENTTFDLCITPYVAPGNVTCDTAENFCSGNDASDILYSYNTIDVLPGDGTINCLFTTPNPTYSVLEIGTSGDILIEMVQNTAFDENDNPIGDALDVDFLLWGPYAPGDDLCVLPAVVDCSYSAAPIENVTLLGATQGEIYLLLITNYAQDPGVIQVRQTNVGASGAGSTIADISAEVFSNDAALVDTGNVIGGFDVDEINTCGFDSVTIEVDSPFADTYIWYEDGFVMPGETGPSITVTSSNNYQVQVFDNQCGSDATSQIVIVNLYEDPVQIADQNITVCDGPEADGIEVFDLDAFTTSLGLGTDFTVTYYTNQSDANQAINPVSSPYTSTGETLIIRIEDSAANANGYLGCRKLADLVLVVNPKPAIGEPNDLEECAAADTATFTLTDNDLAVLNGLNASDFTVSYHTSILDADGNTNALTSPYTNISNPETIYVRLEENATGCYNTEDFQLIVLPNPTVTVQNIEACDDNDGVLDDTANFDLDAQTSSDVTVTYHETQAEADAGTGALTSPISSSGQTVYVRVQSNTTVCYVTANFDLIVLDEPTVISQDIEECDGDDGNIDSSADFDLSAHNAIVLGTQSATDFTVTYHLDQAQADAGTGALPSPYSSAGQTLVVRVTNNVTGCYNTTSFDIIVLVQPIAFSENILECDDNDGILDNTANFNLDNHTAIVLGSSQNPADFVVTYHTTQADADAGVGALSSPYSSAGQVIYVRVDPVGSPCYVTNNFDLIVKDEPLATITTDVFYYDEDSDEFLLCTLTDTGIDLSLILDGSTASDVSIQWTLDGAPLTGETGTTVTAMSQGDYEATLTLNSTGCTYSVSGITVTEVDNCVFPQGISPGEVDGLNDTFDLSYYDVSRLEIYNRNGTLVYSKDNYTNEWIGQTNDGEILPVGTYFYTMVYEGGTKNRSAWVYINR